MSTAIQGPITERARQALLHRSLAGLGHVSAHSRRQLRDLERRWVVQNWRVVAVILGGTMFAAAVAAVLLPTALGDVIAGALLASGWWWLHTIMIETTGATSHRLGLLGETWTSMELAGRRRRGWRHVNDISLDRGQADHVAVGPGGCVVVESKFRNDWSSKALDLEAMATQVQRERRRLSSYLKVGAEARAVVAMWGNNLDDLVGATWFERDGVVFCRGSALGDYLDALPLVFDKDRVRKVHGEVAALVQRRDEHDAEAFGPVPRPWGAHVAEWCLRVGIGTATVGLVVMSILGLGAMWGLGVAVVVAGAAAVVHGRLSSRISRARTAVVAAVSTWIAAALGAAFLVEAIVT